MWGHFPFVIKAKEISNKLGFQNKHQFGLKKVSAPTLFNLELSAKEHFFGRSTSHCIVLQL